MLHIFFRLFILCALMYPFTGFSEEMYTWTDGNGVFHYSNTLPESDGKFEVEEMPNVVSPEAQSKSVSQKNNTAKPKKKDTRTKDERIKEKQSEIVRLNQELNKLRVDHQKKMEALQTDLKDAEEYMVIKTLKSEIEKENKHFESKEKSLEIDINKAETALWATRMFSK